MGMYHRHCYGLDGTIDVHIFARLASATILYEKECEDRIIQEPNHTGNRAALKVFSGRFPGHLPGESRLATLVSVDVVQEYRGSSVAEYLVLRDIDVRLLLGWQYASEGPAGICCSHTACNVNVGFG
jgi:hypothetical protein